MIVDRVQKHALHAAVFYITEKANMVFSLVVQITAAIMNYPANITRILLNAIVVKKTMPLYMTDMTVKRMK